MPTTPDPRVFPATQPAVPAARVRAGDPAGRLRRALDRSGRVATALGLAWSLALGLGAAGAAETGKAPTAASSTRQAPPADTTPAASSADTTPAAPPADTTPAAPPAEGCPPVAGLPTAEQLKAGVAQARDRGFLWRIERDGQVSWLYGTVHVARFDWAFPGPKVSAALRASRLLALELDLSDPKLMQPSSLAVAGADVSLPTDMARRLDGRIRAECLAPAALESLPNLMKAMTLASLAGRRDGLDPAYGIDMVLAGYARGAGKPITGLETLEQQLGALAGDGPADSLRLISQTLDLLESGRARQQARQIAEVWAAGDQATLERYPQWCDCLHTAEDRAAMHRLLDARNVVMADRIEALLREGGGVFVAVGSLHFTGPKGLVTLMKARGWRVERVTFAR